MYCLDTTEINKKSITIRHLETLSEQQMLKIILLSNPRRKKQKQKQITFKGKKKYLKIFQI